MSIKTAREILAIRRDRYLLEEVAKEFGVEIDFARNAIERHEIRITPVKLNIDSDEMGIIERDKESICAMFLALELMIPFKKSITQGDLCVIRDKLDGVIDWINIWSFYDKMNIHIILTAENLYLCEYIQEQF